MKKTENITKYIKILNFVGIIKICVNRAFGDCQYRLKLIMQDEKRHVILGELTR